MVPCRPLLSGEFDEIDGFQRVIFFGIFGPPSSPSTTRLRRAVMPRSPCPPDRAEPCGARLTRASPYRGGFVKVARFAVAIRPAAFRAERNHRSADCRRRRSASHSASARGVSPLRRKAGLARSSHKAPIRRQCRAVGSSDRSCMVVLHWKADRFAAGAGAIEGVAACSSACSIARCGSRASQARQAGCRAAARQGGRAGAAPGPDGRRTAVRSPGSDRRPAAVAADRRHRRRAGPRLRALPSTTSRLMRRAARSPTRSSESDIRSTSRRSVSKPRIIQQRCKDVNTESCKQAPLLP